MGSGQQPWQVLSGLPAWQLTQVPRNSHRDEARPEDRACDDGAAQRAAELVSAWCRSAPVAVAWLRERAGGPVRVITAGPALAAGRDDGQDVLMLPAGARGLRLPDGQAAGLLAAMPCWVQLAGVCDVLLAEDVPGLSPTGRDWRPSLEDGLLSAWLGPFAWLLVAEPADEATLEDMTGKVALAQLEAQRNDSPRAKLAERRAAARHAELRQAASTGLWRVHLLAGAATPQQAQQVAGLLRASTDLAGLPYALLPARHAAPPPERDPRRPGGPRSLFDDPALQWAVADGRQRAAPMDPYQPAPAPAGAPSSPDGRWPAPQPAAPFYGSTALVATLARVPAREVPGLRMVLQPQFDLTPETTPVPGTAPPGTAAAGHGTVRLGEVLDWNRIPCGDLALPASSLNRHLFVCGATGAGKSQTVRGLLEQAAAAGIPWLVVEPAKAEYRLMAARLRDAAEVIAIRPGDLAVAPAGINPLEPAAGPGGARFPLQAHADMLRALFLAAFAAEEPFPQVLAAALTRCYEQAGWDLVTGQPAVPGAAPGYPGLRDLQDTALAVVEDIGYSREVTDNVRGFVAVRIGSLRLGTTGRFLDGGCPLDFGRLLASNVVLEIEDCGDDGDKAFLTGAVLIRLAQYLRLRHHAEGPQAGGLRHLTVIEEAHRLLRQPPPGTGNGPAAHATEMFAGLLAEVRAYGEGLVIAEQIPSKPISDVIKNTAVKIVHRLPALDDRQAVGATMNLTDAQSRYLVTLTPGEAAVFTDGMDYPVLARMPDGTDREASATAQPASPAGLAGTRSAACPPACPASPCSLGLMRAAQNSLARDPRITLWAELAVLGHLAGWPIPVPDQATMATDILALDPRLRDCAIAHAVDDAVAARIPAITPAPAGGAAAGSGALGATALAAHVATAMRAALGDGHWPCQPDEPQWLAPAWQWERLLAILESWERDHPGSGPHPDTTAWQARLGRRIPGDTCAQQATAVWSWHTSAQRDPRAITGATFGHRTPSAIEQAVGACTSDPDWDTRLTGALADFTFNGPPWPATLLSRPQPDAVPR